MAKMGMNEMVQFTIALIFIGSIAGVGAIVLDALNGSTTATSAQTIIGNALTAITNFTSQLGTVGTVVGVVFLLSIVMIALGGVEVGGSYGGGI